MKLPVFRTGLARFQVGRFRLHKRMNETHLRLAASIFPRLDVRRYRTAHNYRDEIDHLATSIMVGGFVLFEGGVDDVLHGTTRLASLTGGRLLFAADCENGLAMRFSGGTEFPSMMALGVANDLAATYSVARSVAREMRALGIVWNFAPVADVNANPDNPIINIRSFGSRPDVVSDHVLAYVRGMQDGGVIACAKHFPGHGNTTTDSHLDVPVVAADRRSLDASELPPFREAVRQGVRSVMVAHISLPSVDPSGSPASLSPLVVGSLLRDELGFDGLVVTDALDMYAITRRFNSEEAASLAYAAGCDVLCLPEAPACALHGLTQLAEARGVGKRRINKSYERIRAALEWTKAYSDVPADLASARRGHEVIALDAARRSITVVGRMRRLRPPVLVVALVDADGRMKADEWFSHFTTWFDGESRCIVVMPEVDGQEQEDINGAIDDAGSVITAIFIRPRGFSGTVGLSPAQHEIARRCLGKPSVLLTFGSPYPLRDARPQVRIDCYSSGKATLAASIEALSRVVK